MKLTQKQETFTQNIFKGMTQREAWIQAGYSSNYALAIIDVHACQLANKDKVKVRYNELQQKAEDESIATVIERKQILTEIARGRVGSLLDDNQRIKQGEHLDASIQEVDTFDVKIGKGENAKLAQITKIKLHNPIPAVDLLNKMEKIYSDGATVNVDNRTVNINVSSEKAKSLTQRLIEGERTDAV